MDSIACSCNGQIHPFTLTPCTDYEQGCFSLAVNMEDIDDIQHKFNAFDQHQEEGNQPEIVEQNRNDGAHHL